MSTPYIIYNDVDSRTLGVVMQSMPDFNRPQRRTEIETVPGRDGSILRDIGAYDAYTASMSVNCMGVDLATVYNWLSGSGWLISSDEPERKVWVSLHSEIKNTHFRASGNYDQLTVSVYCQPFRYFIDYSELTITSTGTITNPGTAYSAPVIKISGLGDTPLMVNGNLIEINGLDSAGLLIDCEEMDCFNLAGTELRNSMVDLTAFPKMYPGANSFQWTNADNSNKITSITIDGRWRDL